MFKFNDVEMPLINSLKKKISVDRVLCNRDLKNANTWKLFERMVLGKKLVLYGTGEMFEYFCRAYLQQFKVDYAVDKNISSPGIKKNDISVYPLQKLTEQQEDYVVLVTPIDGIDDIFLELKSVGVENCFSLPVMEYQRLIIRLKVLFARIFKFYTYKYQLEWKINKLEQRIENTEKRIQGIQQRQTERYHYLKHTNRIVNALIDKTGDDELKKTQMIYTFKKIHKNTYIPNFDNPKTFNEKILYMTLYDHNSLYTEVSDKYLFKQYVAEKAGSEYVVPLLGVWDSPEDIDFSSLPQKFVLKSTDGGDSQKVILVNDKEKLDINETVTRMQTWKYKYENDYYYNFNWPFKGIKQRFIAEELLDTEGLRYYDFKVHCFHGEPKYIHVVSQNPHEVTYFDTDWNPQTFIHGYPLIHYDVPRPGCLKEMLNLSRELSKPFKYVRVDFYVLKDKLYLGELTLTTLGGLAPFEPASVDFEWGKLI